VYELENYISVRRSHYRDGKSQREIAREQGYNRRTVKKMIDNPEPIRKKRTVDESRSKLNVHKEFINDLLEADKSVHKKQRHTKLRIYNRLKEERGYTGSYQTICNYVSSVAFHQKEMYIPLIHSAGESEFDFGEADVLINTVKKRIHLGVMYLPYSGVLFVKGYEVENTETFCDAHKSAFEFLRGVPSRILYDNSKIAIQKIFTHGIREKTKGFLRLKSHYLFDDVFANPAKGNEKGGVENSVGYMRRNFMVPLPEVNSIEELNAHLYERCLNNFNHVQQGHTKTTGERLKEEQLNPLPSHSYEAFCYKSGVVNRESLVRFCNNSYSVPTKYGTERVFIKGYADKVQIIFNDQVIAEHKRLYDKDGYQFNPLHYLSLLALKSRAFHQAAPLKDWHLPDIFERVHQHLLKKDPLNGTRSYIHVLCLLMEYSMQTLERILRQAMNLNCVEIDAIRHLLKRRNDRKIHSLKLTDRPELEKVTVESTDLSVYSKMIDTPLETSHGS
jgi:transposase